MERIIRTLKSPAYRLVIETAWRNWWLIACNLFTNLLSAVLEGATLGIIYVAVAYLTEGESGSNSSFALPVVQFITWLFPFPDKQIPITLITVAVLLQILLSVSAYMNKVSMAFLSAKAQPYVTKTVFERIMTFSYSCVSRYKVGDLVMFANDAARAVDQQLTEFNNIILHSSFVLVYVAVIVKLSPVLAAATAIVTLTIAFIQYKLVPRLRQVVKRVTNSQVEVGKFMTESIQALQVLHTYGKQEETVTQANQLLNKMRTELQKRALIFYLPEPILDTLPIFALGILAASAVVFQGGESTILPLLLTFLLALKRLSLKLKKAALTIMQFVDNSGRMQRLEMILDRRDKVFEHSGTIPFTGLQGGIEFQGVSHSYDDQGTFALKDVTFTIPQNQVTALVGKSGAGKSSIIDLLIGLYQPTAGKITINEIRLANYRLVDLRNRMGVVSQETFVFNNSIIENLRYGYPNASREDVIEAAKAAQAHQFIEKLPNGYETEVGERGYRLSGGQRQRLALARALIKQPEILILDEATSALDSESEQLIQHALKKFQKNRTVIVVAHRLSTVIEADQIIVLEDGQIVERGTHSSLLQQRGPYYRYWQIQSGDNAYSSGAA